MSTDSNKSFAHAFIRDLLNERVPLGKIADHLEESFDSIHQASQLAQVQQEFHAYQELCTLRERLHHAAAIPLASAKLVRILELPEPTPTGHAARDDRARYQHATLMLRTIDKLDRRTRTSSRTNRTITTEGARAHAATPPPCENHAPSVPSEPACRTRENDPVHIAPTPDANPIAAPQAPKPTQLLPISSEHGRTQAPPLPAKPAATAAEEEPASARSVTTASQNNPPANPDEANLQPNLHPNPQANPPHPTTDTDTPPHKPSLARAG